MERTSPAVLMTAMRRSMSSPKKLFALSNPPRARGWMRMVYLAGIFAIMLMVALLTYSEYSHATQRQTVTAIATEAPRTANNSEGVTKDVAHSAPPFDISRPMQVRARTGPATVAVVLYGVRFNGLLNQNGRVGLSLRRYLLEELDADVFVCGDERFDAERHVRAALGDAHVVDVHLEAPPSDADVLAHFAASPSGSWFARQQARGDHHRSDALAAPALHSYRWIEKGYHRVMAYEALHGFRYQYVHFQRPDLEWFAPHPPLRLLTPDRLFFPSRNGWGGLPVGSVVCPRGLCSAFAEFHTMLHNGTLAHAMITNRQLCTQPCIVERFVAMYLKMMRIRVGMFRNVAAVVCVPSLCGPTDDCYRGDVPACEEGQKYRHNTEAEDFEATSAMMWALTAKVKGWDALLWEWEPANVQQV